MSDIHAYADAFADALELVDLSGDNKLILLGDYIHYGPDPYGVLERIETLQRRYPGRVVALAGNHEDMALDGRSAIEETWYGADEDDDPRVEKFLRWMGHLQRYYVEGHIIFVHAGIEEEAEDLWELGTDDFTFTEKYPAQTGRFFEDWIIVAGHIGTSELADDPRFHNIFFDGESHYYIDGTVSVSGVIPVLKIDMSSGKFYEAGSGGDRLILPYGSEE